MCEDGCGRPALADGFARCLTCFHRYVDTHRARTKNDRYWRPDPARSCVPYVQIPRAAGSR